MTIVALIPARAGSKRIPGKNTRLLAGHPLIAYTIAAAQQSGIFASIHLCTDSTEATSLLRDVPTGTVIWRQPVPDDQPDIVWVRDALSALYHPTPDAFAILRPTSPFRTAATIRRAWAKFLATPCDSLRAVERWDGPTPFKMWEVFGDHMLPVAPEVPGIVPPWHSRPTQTLAPVYLQNASLEIAWTRTVTELGSISGKIISPFFTEGHEGFDLNTMADWYSADTLIATGAAVLPPIETPCPR